MKEIKRRYKIKSDAVDAEFKCTEAEAFNKMEKMSNATPDVQFDLYEIDGLGRWAWSKTHISSNYITEENT
mgnify:CR=1 FL=1|tara:strand:+ start:3688 stop:3900 length:213 start_codon:yes stop_codon:yes gene_type:complete